MFRQPSTLCGSIICVWSGTQLPGDFQRAGLTSGLDACCSKLRIGKRWWTRFIPVTEHKPVSLHFNKGLAGGTDSAIAETRRTATNPTACDAFALAIIADGEGSAYPGIARQPVDVAAGR